MTWDDKWGSYAHRPSRSQIRVTRVTYFFLIIEVRTIRINSSTPDMPQEIARKTSSAKSIFILITEGVHPKSRKYAFSLEQMISRNTTLTIFIFIIASTSNILWIAYPMCLLRKEISCFATHTLTIRFILTTFRNRNDAIALNQQIIRKTTCAFSFLIVLFTIQRTWSAFAWITVHIVSIYTCLTLTILLNYAKSVCLW